MTRYWVELWQSGKMIEVLFCQADNLPELISQLSDEYKGVFRLQSKQTEQQRYKENLRQLERVAGDFQK